MIWTALFVFANMLALKRTRLYCLTVLEYFFLKCAMMPKCTSSKLWVVIHQQLQMGGIYLQRLHSGQTTRVDDQESGQLLVGRLFVLERLITHEIRRST